MDEIQTDQEKLIIQEMALDLFSKEAHLSVSKRAIKILGLCPAIFLSDLISKHKYFLNKNDLDKDGFFFSKQDHIENNTGVSKYEQRKAIKLLESLGILETKKVGLPMLLWYKVNYNAVITNLLKISLIELKNFTYNNKNKYNKVSKDTYIDSSNLVNPSRSSKKEQPIIECPVPFLLEEWRTFPQVPKSQHHLRENTKTHLRINMLTTLLMKGMFGSQCAIDPKFLEQNKIPKSALSYKFTEKDLSDGIYEMSKMFMEGNYPEDKSAIKKMTFADLIYHSRSHVSYLLKYLYKDVRPLEYKTVQVYDHWLEKLYEEGIFDRDIEDDHHQFGILKKGLAGIEEYYKWINEQIIDTLTCYSLIDTEDKFFDIYVDWLNETLVHPVGYSIGLNSQAIWYKFIKWLEEAIHGDFVHQYPTLDRRRYESTK